MTDAHILPESDENLPLASRAALGGGSSFWQTKQIGPVGPITLSDGPHGIRFQEPSASDHLGIGGSIPATCFPPAVGLGQSWDPDLIEQIGGALAVEAQAAGVGVLLGPGINIKRDPRCGRNFEYFSEDPYLTGALATGWVRGLQSGGVGASVKHFAANNAESDRMRASSDVDERTLREIYLRAFSDVIRDAKPWTVMCSYNKINGMPAAENSWLLTDILRSEWGYSGAVISDWGAITDRVASVAAGVDLQMPGDTQLDDQSVVDAVVDGRLREAAVDRAAAAVTELVQKVSEARRPRPVDFTAHHALARHAAAASIVLLKNEEDLLPLPMDLKQVAVIGALARKPRYQGGGSSHVNATRVDNPLEELRTILGAHKVTFADGYDTDTTDGDPDASSEEAVTRASEADMAIVFLGLGQNQESEGFDRTSLDLPDDQIALLHRLAAVQPRLVAVVSAGGVLDLRTVDSLCGAVISGGLLGQGAGHAIAQVLTGEVNPSGRLTETVPLRLQDAPSYPHFPGEHSHVRYGEGIFVGYRGYDIRELEVLYPFGHGLSYTTFSYEQARTVVDATHIHMTVTVKNRGERAGREVVQVYAAKLDPSVSRAPQELTGFQIVQLEPGHEKDVTIRIPRDRLAYWHDTLDRWVIEGGEYEIRVGPSSRDARQIRTVHIDGDEVPTRFSMDSTITELLAHPVTAAAISRMFAEGMQSFEDSGTLGADISKLMGDIPIGRVVHSFLGDDGADAQEALQLLFDSVNTTSAAAG